jgi:hypothetical protein
LPRIGRKGLSLRAFVAARIETFFESEYPRLDALYMDIHDMDIHAYPNKAR